ncbi:sulfate permease [Caulobacter sp. Root656]|nr:sulfate permease [Caulobacter sp. Root656]
MGFTWRRDAIAGLSVAGLLLPEAVAYASIAGLPPGRGVAAAVVGVVGYVLVGRSRFAIVAPTSSSAVILAATLASLAGDTASRLAAATIITALVGATFLLAGAARLGSLASFISRPVLTGFAFGLAVTIIVGQAPALMGVPAGGSGLGRQLLQLLEAAPQCDPVSLAIGGLALAVLLLLRRFPAVPGALLVLAVGAIVSAVADLPSKGVAVVGALRLAPVSFSIPCLAQADHARVAQFTLPLVLMLLAESWGTIRTLGLRRGDTAEANREMGALGVANLASAVAQGMPVGAGFSASAASETAGAASRGTALVASVAMVLLVVVAGRFFAFLPRSVLSAVVIAALTHALDVGPLVRLWRLGRDQYVALAAAVAVLCLGVLNGLLAAVLLSVVALVHRLSRPRLTRLGRLAGGHDYVDLSRHGDAVAPLGVAIWRPAAPLFFGNAERTLAAIATETARDGARQLVVSLEESFDLDSTALDALLEFDAALRRRAVRLRLARVHDHVRDLLAAADANDLLARCDYSVDDAVAAMQGAAIGQELHPTSRSGS